jgi:hypothetical protein
MMATGKTDTSKPKADKLAAESTSDEPAADAKTSDCVVDGGKGFHVGRAVNGKVCSYHAMHYDAQGNRR